MKRFFGMGLIALALVACDNETNPLTSPTGDGTPGGLTPNTIPAGLAGNLTRISYDGANTLTVEMWALDTGTFTATYQRNPALDTAGYTGFSVRYQVAEKAGNRSFSDSSETTGVAWGLSSSKVVTF